jgi:hypothetical protein
MFTQPLDPQTQARRALGKVYALLYRLAEEKPTEQKTVNVVPLAGGTLTAERLTPAKESQP